MNKKTVVFDFDGVIHSYTSGWIGDTAIPNPPFPGIREAIVDIRKKYRVVVVSTRCASEEGKAAIKEWLAKYDIVVDDITKEKPPAVVYIDDRAICFDGHPELLRSKIEAFKPWYQAKKDIEEQVCDLSEFLFRYPVPFLCSSGYSEKREGEWIAKTVMARTPNALNHTCSVCGSEGRTTPYCPNCGAKMKGGE